MNQLANIGVSIVGTGAQSIRDSIASFIFLQIGGVTWRCPKLVEIYEQGTSTMVDEKVIITIGSEPIIIQRSALFTPVKQEGVNLGRHA